jgi:hypothetical protein
MQNDLPAGRQDNPPVHEKTKTGADWRYGCNNHPKRKSGYWAPNREYDDTGNYTETKFWIETEWLDYDVCPAAHEHQGCEGCRHAMVKA